MTATPPSREIEILLPEAAPEERVVVGVAGFVSLLEILEKLAQVSRVLFA